MQQSVSSVAECPKPVIAAVHGYCIGGGVDLSRRATSAWRSADAVFSVRETKIAIVADLGSLQRLPRIIGKGHVAELAYTGKDITAARAKEIGLVNDVLPDAEAALAAARAGGRDRRQLSARRAGHEGGAAGCEDRSVCRRARLRGDLERRVPPVRRPRRGLTRSWRSARPSSRAAELTRASSSGVSRSAATSPGPAPATRLRALVLAASRARPRPGSRGATASTMSSACSRRLSDLSGPPDPGSSSIGGSTRLPCTQPASARRRSYEGQSSGQRHGASGARSSTQNRATSPVGVRPALEVLALLAHRHGVILSLPRTRPDVDKVRQRLTSADRAAAGERQPTEPSICSSISRLHSTAYSIGQRAGDRLDEAVDDHAHRLALGQAPAHQVEELVLADLRDRRLVADLGVALGDLHVGLGLRRRLLVEDQRVAADEASWRPSRPRRRGPCRGRW